MWPRRGGWGRNALSRGEQHAKCPDRGCLDAGDRSGEEQALKSGGAQEHIG